MSLKIGFTAQKENEQATAVMPAVGIQSAPRKSVVRVYFPERDMTCAYYNDAFDLHPGDTVYVEGKLEGLRGRVVEVSYSFKIKLTDYKRVISKADTEVHGEFFMGGSHFIAFDPFAIPFAKVRTWFKAPEDPEDPYVSCTEDRPFSLDRLDLKIKPHIAERGEDYYLQNRVAYISIDGDCGRAIVEGGEPYEVEFTYRNGQISNLICNCFCTDTCKHEFAAMLQLRETLRIIEEHYAEPFRKAGYFAAVRKQVLFSIAIDSKESGRFTL